ncbi:MAG TPA: TlpA disulfide reductase family protein [Anaerolineaceae bacterium]|jgi:cytochrome c biogenesis protein CcmG/thiol:disulfide interchange protein DsbE|nr:TlpA disulfide reductase family protein [Anaerolineaceae bacterium]
MTAPQLPETPLKNPTPRRISWAIPVAFILLIGFLVLLGISLSRTQSGRPDIGDRAPEFTLTTFAGDSIRSTDLVGQVVLLNFWASWCLPCAEEAAALEQVWRDYQPGGQVMFIGVDYVDTEPEARAYLQDYNVTYPNGPDLGTRISRAYRITGVPETYLIDASGIIRGYKLGPFTSVAEIQQFVAGALTP